MSLTDVRMTIEDLSRAVQFRLNEGRFWGVRQGEVTITDVFLLDLKRQRFQEIDVYPVDRVTESRDGMDWELWIRRDQSGWRRYAIQAKVLDVNDYYPALGHMVGQRRQFDLLAEFCDRTGARGATASTTPPQTFETSDLWHCSFPREDALLGCTFAPLERIRYALDTRGERTFRAIHRQPDVVPLRCLFHDEPDLEGPISVAELDRSLYSELPDFGSRSERGYLINGDVYGAMAPRFIVTADALAQPRP